MKWNIKQLCMHEEVKTELSQQKKKELQEEKKQPQDLERETGKNLSLLLNCYQTQASSWASEFQAYEDNLKLHTEALNKLKNELGGKYVTESLQQFQTLQKALENACDQLLEMCQEFGKYFNEMNNCEKSLSPNKS